ncbi:uncharacterized protein Z518_10367 [Rhinocladiella mackenziei CBS 650.93]|uniref:Uncharacterized protein n=1 Tax=Rhinocladiella mackenziei CBS 650.93 TaxID=1442369 RepID=A0A0D2GPE1_9EURO|nr:uncharacterized protein Z518_10367 [Rhinocladiella mackenziei CBS 650.93]KIX00228.1 hypothetical protein Z518_10367 [Rhinocladiella mackenziei CBS 650.93]
MLRSRAYYSVERKETLAGVSESQATDGPNELMMPAATDTAALEHVLIAAHVDESQLRAEMERGMAQLDTGDFG